MQQKTTALNKQNDLFLIDPKKDGANFLFQIQTQTCIGVVNTLKLFNFDPVIFFEKFLKNLKEKEAQVKLLEQTDTEGVKQ